MDSRILNKTKCLETNSHYVIWAGLELTIFQADLKLIILCFSFLNTRIKGTCHYAWLSLYIFLFVRTKYLMSKSKRGKVYFVSQFAEVLVPCWLAPRQSSMPEGHGRGETAHGAASRMQQAVFTLDSHTQDEVSHYPHSEPC